ncbi:hypothetical protein MSTE_03546 [Mycobacteroides stephanolepidis]|uniref:Uncharacterized protein n=1 Tax=[Mycobacterium] stephanolepidis TaxID=1520670 RepID=A0A1Z4F0V8_9MYCO|nr:hypothetical protein [[Mycobacterium] stephanolepidis]BAX98846.1 hypothetical protein MSTE_03546 [[Mycobacterium] stephanolepidis]
MTNADDFPAKTVKQNADGHVAVRRNTAADDPMAWGVMTIDAGGHYASSAEVEEWPVIAGPPS